MVSDPLYAMKREALRRGFSHRTVCTYSQCVKQFMRFCKKDLKEVTKKDVNEYLDHFVDAGCAGNTLNVHLNAVKFMLQDILGKRVMLKFRYSKKPKTLPVFLTKEEVIQLFSVVQNPTHLLILEMMYSAGLRVSEAVNLRKRDFDFSQDYGWVRGGKGNKDRPFIIAKRIKEKLEVQIKNNCCSEESFLFHGRNGHLTVRSVQQILCDATKKAGIKKNIHPHTLRHSFATHLIEAGYDVITVRPLMGHNSAETTNTYLHMVRPRMINVRSPYDDLCIRGMNLE